MLLSFLNQSVIPYAFLVFLLMKLFYIVYMVLKHKRFRVLYLYRWKPSRDTVTAILPNFLIIPKFISKSLYFPFFQILIVFPKFMSKSLMFQSLYFPIFPNFYCYSRTQTKSFMRPQLTFNFIFINLLIFSMFGRMHMLWHSVNVYLAN